MSVELVAIRGLPEFRPGDDLGEIVADAVAPVVRDGDVVVVTQKIVSKAEGRIVPDTDGKNAWIRRESRRVVARRGDLLIAETRHGFVCANAGIDSSNVPEGFLSLLPEDPDASAAALRERLESRTGKILGVVITDTFGRPWRRGVVNVAIGCAGIASLIDLRGTADANGRLLQATIVALADEVAAASGLVIGKADGVPVALVRGLDAAADPSPASALVRAPSDDLFPHSPLVAIEARRTVRAFADEPVPRETVVEAVRASMTAPVPHGSRRASRPWLWVVLDAGSARRRLLGALAEAWRRDLEGDGVAGSNIERRLQRSDALLGAAPALAVPALSLAGADAYPDERRREAERDMFLLATGAAVQNFMLGLSAQGYGSAWVSSTLFAKDVAREALGLEQGWLPMGAVAIGRPADEAPARPPIDPGRHLRFG